MMDTDFSNIFPNPERAEVVINGNLIEYDKCNIDKMSPKEIKDYLHAKQIFDDIRYLEKCLNDIF